jgi:hypothetical protein
MTIVPILIGGLGNRLYQIANAFRLQNQFKTDIKFYRINPKLSDVPKYRHLILRPSDFDDFGGHELLIKEGLPKTINEIFPNFNFEVNPTEIDEILLNKNLYYENNINSLDPKKDAVVMGYFFSYSFVRKTVNRVKESFNPSIQSYIDNKYSELKTKRVLGIHLRLGVNTDNNPALEIDPNFYSSIIERERNNTDIIFVVSDNISRSKEFMSMVNIHGKEVKFIEEEPMYVDLLVLSNCKSLIIAPSTLSAWSSYMNDHKNIYVPRIWTKHHWTNDVPLEWKLL